MYNIISYNISVYIYMYTYHRAQVQNHGKRLPWRAPLGNLFWSCLNLSGGLGDYGSREQGVGLALEIWAWGLDVKAWDTQTSRM